MPSGRSISAQEFAATVHGDHLRVLSVAVFRPRDGDVDRRASGDVFGGVEIAIVEHDDFVRRSRGADRRADEDAALFRVDSDPHRVAVLPVDRVPRRLNFLRNLDWLAAAEKIEAGAVRDDHPIFADTDAANRRRAELARNFRDAPERGLVGAVVLRRVERMFFDEIEALAQFERGANRLAVVFGDAEQAVDAVEAFGIFDAARAHDRRVDGLSGRRDLDAVDEELAVERGRAVGVNAQDQIGRNRRERRGELRR